MNPSIRTALVVSIAFLVFASLIPHAVSAQTGLSEGMSQRLANDRAPVVGTVVTAFVLPRRDEVARRGMPTWVKWGIVGAVAGAVTFPLLASPSAGQSSNTARAATGGAVSGFVIVGGAVLLWQSICGPDSGSRRAGLCG